MYNGAIVDINQKESGYTYNNGKFYKTKTIVNNVFTNQFLNFSGTTDEKFYIYDIDSNNTIQQTNYAIDLNNNCEIYNKNEYTDYHFQR